MIDAIRLPEPPPTVDGVDRAADTWGANCGPGALAAALRLTLADVRCAVEDGGGPTIVLLRFCGPWDTVPRAADTYRHAIAYRRIFVEPLRARAQSAHGPGWVLDVNNQSVDDRTFWIPHHQWCNRSLLDLLPERGDGRVAVDWIAQVDRP